MGRACIEASRPSSSSSPPAVTTSTSIYETVNGEHVFRISGYSLSKGIGIGKYVASDTFMVGGYSWAIYFYPDGKSIKDNASYVSLFIALASGGSDVRALFELTLIDQSGKERHKVHSHFGRALENGPYILKYRGSMWGYKRFFKRSALETSDYLKDDCLQVHCCVGVVRSHTEGPKSYSIHVPPSDIGQHFGQLLECGKGADVSFEVNGETFDAHKLMRRGLEIRLATALKEIAAAEEEKLEKERSAREALLYQETQMEKVVQESRRLTLEAEENSKLQEFLMDRGRAIEILQGEISVKCQDVLLLKEKFDKRIPLSRSLSSSQTSSILASSGSSFRSNVTPFEPEPETFGTSKKSAEELGGDSFDKISRPAVALQSPKLPVETAYTNVDDFPSGVANHIDDRKVLLEDGWDFCDTPEFMPPGFRS